MRNIKNISDKRYLIDYANIQAGIIKYQKNFLDEDQFYDFIKNPYKGFPLLLPLGLKYFDYSNCKSSFFINKHFFYKKIYLVNNNRKINYLDKIINIPEWYCTGAVPKKKFKNYVKNIIKQNLQIKKKIYYLKKKFPNLIAFQTRNIPHYGHQKIIEYLLSRFNCVIINPLTGIKKRGDVKSNILEKIFRILIKNNYSKKNIFYLPIVANFFYAGPRESMHHLNLREMLGFTNFIIGRDHAGIGKIYDPLDAYNFCKKYKKKFIIKPFLIKGAYYSKISKSVEVNKKNIKKNSIINISGTAFRSFIQKKKIYNFANPLLQEYIHKMKNKIFY
jgi:sulfate adenylyltransferase